ncbi:MAG TPA: universal stress protein [Bryobacteraceae bacterium]|nr:universal stress protein [Bryobacteraceae bacterium]
MLQLSISNILVPVDFSRRVEHAARTAQCLAAHFHAELTLLHVMERFHVGYAMVEPFEASLRELARAHRSKMSAQLDSFAFRDSKDVKVTRIIAEGDASDEILKCSKDADLMVMPTQGHSRLRGMLIGSVTAKVLDESSRPILTGAHLEQEGGLAEWQPFRNILCAVDLGARTDCVLGWGAALANEFHAKVTMLHVSSDPTAGDRLASVLRTAGIEASALVAGGDPHKVVAATAAQIKADLVIIGRGTAAHTLGRLRAQAYGIIRQAPCPVLSV